MRITRLDAPVAPGGEQPLWDPTGQVLWYLDNAGNTIHRFSPATGETSSWPTPSVVTSFALRECGGAVVTMRIGIHLFDFATGGFEPVWPLPEPPPFVFNDGKVDRRGRWFVGACTSHFDAPTPEGGLYRLDPDHRVTKLDEGVYFSNGPCFAPDDRTFYFADSYLNTIFAYDYDLDRGAVSNKRAFVNTESLGGMPDGATVDRDGMLWTAIYGGGKVAAFAPDAHLVRTVDLPVRFTSSVTFGGPELDRLYVTTIRHDPPGGPSEPDAGSVYVVDDLGVRGIPEPRFAG